MSDLIKREDAIKAVSKVDDYGDGIGFEVRSHCLVELELVPSADSPRGEWIDLDDKWGFEGTFKCSACGELWSLIDGTPQDNGMNYCPNCGARMFAKDTNVPNKKGADYDI